MPLTLGEAIGTEPAWLQAWVFLLGFVHLAALVFAVGRTGGRWIVRPEPFAVIVSFVAAGIAMGWLYEQVGYVRMLGLAHVVCWTPAYAWVVSRRHALPRGSLYAKWVYAYLIIAGISLVIDVVDVVRYLVGDGALLHRWG